MVCNWGCILLRPFLIFAVFFFCNTGSNWCNVDNLFIANYTSYANIQQDCILTNNVDYVRLFDQHCVYVHPRSFYPIPP